MKLYVLLFLFIISSDIFTQSAYEIQTDENSGKPMLVGTITREEIQKTVFNEWWSEEYANYEVDVIGADQLISYLENVKIKIIAASWCSDSRELVPQLYKVLDYLTLPEEDIELIFVNRDKTGLADEVNGLSIDFVPTIIFYTNDTESGRIVETPFESIELDMLSILYDPLE